MRNNKTTMSTKAEIIEKLTEAKIDHDPESTKAELEALLPEEDSADTAASAKKGKTETVGGVEIGDPQELRPVDLPLVVKPAKGGEWKNEAQARFAATLNAYAYKNPKKWAEKKGDRTFTDSQGRKSTVKGLISQLIEIGEDAEAIKKYESNPENLTYSDKRISA